jgi:cytochrome c-type biogenesis protein
MVELQIYFGVLLAGLASFLSPCVLPLVPPYLGFLGGASIETMSSGGAGFDRAARTRLAMAALAFVLGFTTVFVALGASASLIGQLLLQWRGVLGIAAGAVIVLFGLHFLGWLRIPLLYREARYHSRTEPASLLGAYVVGLAFAFGWTPCIGPILSAVITVAGSTASLTRGIGLLFTYSMGLAIPFLLAALAISPFLGFMQRFKRHLGTVEKVMGAALVLTGLLMLTGSLNWFGAWLLETYPGIAKIETLVVPESLRGQILRQNQGG